MLDDVSITHLQFSAEFARSIEEKQVMQQKAEKAKFDVLRNEWEQKAMILRAEGEAEAAGLISAAIEKYGSGLVAMRKIDAAQFIANELSGS